MVCVSGSTYSRSKADLSSRISASTPPFSKRGARSNLLHDRVGESHWRLHPASTVFFGHHAGASRGWIERRGDFEGRQIRALTLVAATILVLDAQLLGSGIVPAAAAVSVWIVSGYAVLFVVLPAACQEL
jgi:hypothetical protein